MPRNVALGGVGNEVRGDDRARLEAVRRVPECELPASVTGELHDGGAVGLLELWEGADSAVLVDTARSGAPPGTIYRLHASRAPSPSLAVLESHDRHRRGDRARPRSANYPIAPGLD
jgi:hydrogenase maturation protease